MLIPCQEIANLVKKNLASRVKSLKKRKVTPKLVTFFVGESTEQLSFVAIKKKVARSLGIEFEFIHSKRIPEFSKFADMLRHKSEDPNTTGIIVQQPLPSLLHSNTLYNFVSVLKEIEGYQKKSPYLPPLGLAVLTALKYVFNGRKVSKDLIIDLKTDINFFKNALKHKKVVLIGRGPTGGKPIAQTLSFFKINFLNTNSQTHNPTQYYEEGDIIITAVGKKIVAPESLKPGVVLINAGLRKEGKQLKGDYDEKEIRNVSSFYTKTPGGIGPLDVLYLYKNLLDAAELQVKRSN